MTRRIIEIILGAIIAIALIVSYADRSHPSQLLIWYVLTPKVLKTLAWLLLFFVAGRLIFGPYKDYSKYFYNLWVKIFGDPKRANEEK
jgi:hypothetical protein